MSINVPVFLRTTAASSCEAPVSERFYACVRNTGNYFYEESLLRQLRNIHVARSLEDLPARVETLVLSMSNFISSTTDLGYLYDELSARSVEQVVMIGAGAQAYEFGDRIALTEGTRRFLGFVAARSVSIGVRGHYTAEVLARLGIRNVDVIGCPSAFWKNGAPAFAWSELPEKPRLAVHSTPLGHFRDKVSALMAHGMRHDADYVLQSETWMMPLLGAGGDEDSLDRGILYYAYPECDPIELRAWLKRKLVVFFDMERWLQQIANYDLVYGSRFHGNMAAIQAGVPALNMPFDTRTRELCEYLNLPTLQLKQFCKDVTPQQLRDLADFDLFCRTYPVKQRAYANFLERNGLIHCLQLGDLVQSRSRDLDAGALAGSIRSVLTDISAVGGVDVARLRAMILERLLEDRDAASRNAAEVGLLDKVR